jgi:GTP1/Obg family GTP-binding protein
MACKEYQDMEDKQKMARSTWAQFTYRENMHLRGGAGDQEAKQLAREARARVTEIGKQMHWHREYCEECKVRT